jgi:hypothetical protein
LKPGALELWVKWIKRVQPHRGVRDTSVEVEAVRLHLLVPLRSGAGCESETQGLKPDFSPDRCKG